MSLFYRAAVFLLLALPGLLMVSCANLGAPTGGPKDLAPPNLLSTFPADQSTNFKGQSVILTFDEWIEVRKLNQNLQIAPLTDNKYSYEIRKNELILEFDEPFEDSTTYTFAFGAAVTDITEKNEAQNIRLAFSTGPTIDTLVLDGYVRNLMNAKPVKNTAVMLYDATDSLDVQTDKPLYLAQTDSTGYFRLQNLRPGNYYAYALKENKGNFIYDKSEEKIGFLTRTVAVREPQQRQNFQIINYDLDTLLFRTARKNNQFFEMKFTKPFSSYQAELLDTKYDTIIYHDNREEYLTFFYRNLSEPDSTEARVRVQDRVGRSVDTTLMLYFEPTKRPRNIDFKVVATPTNGSKITPKDSLRTEIRFTKPVFAVNQDSLLMKVDRDTVWQPVSESLMSWNHNRTRLELKHAPFDSVFAWKILDHAFISVEQDSSEATTLKYSLKQPEEFGIISGKVVGLPPGSHFLLQLMDGDKVEQSLYDAFDFRFEFVKPGDKSFRILIDENGNRRWDKGDFRYRKLPERIYFPKNKVQLKANWEIEDEQIVID